MTRIARVIALTTLFWSACLAAQAQNGVSQGAPRHRAGHPVMMALALAPPALLNTITPLKPDQSDRITAIQQQLRSDVRALRTGAAAPSPELRSKQHALVAKAAADVTAVLTQEQLAAVHSFLPAVAMLHTIGGIPAPAIARLNLTRDQLAGIRALGEQTRAQLKGLSKQDRQAKIPALRTDYRTKLQSILTAEQQQAINQR